MCFYSERYSDFFHFGEFKGRSITKNYNLRRLKTLKRLLIVLALLRHSWHIFIGKRIIPLLKQVRFLYRM